MQDFKWPHEQKTWAQRHPGAFKAIIWVFGFFMVLFIIIATIAMATPLLFFFNIG